MLDAVLLIGFGGPTCREEIRPFLDNILRGRPVPTERYEEVVHHYEMMGGRSPYNQHTMRQADALRARRAERILGFILAPHRCEASWERYQAAVDDARSKIGPDAPQVEYPKT